MAAPLSLKMLHVATGADSRCLATAYFRAKLSELGELDVYFDGAAMSPDQIAALVRQHNVYLAGWSSVALPASLAREPGQLRYICGITGSMRSTVPEELTEAGITLTNWGDAIAKDVAEGAMVLLQGCVKSMHARIERARKGNFWGTPAEMGDTLSEMNVGIYGCGAIGRHFIELLRPFGAVMRVFDPYLREPPADCEIVSSLQALFAKSQAIVIHAGLTSQTYNTVTEPLLARLPDGGIIINTARGAIIDQTALFRELESGRLRGGLDVLEPDGLDASHPAYRWENLILTGHAIGDGPPADPNRPRLARMEKYCLDNLRRFSAGKPLRFVMDLDRYRLVETIMHKTGTRGAQNLYLTAPFTVGSAETFVVDRSAGPMRPGADQLPGPSADFIGVQEGMSAGETRGYRRAQRVNHLVQLSPMRHGARELVDITALPATTTRVYFWLRTNYWETNFTPELGGFYSFRFGVLRVEQMYDPGEAIRTCGEPNAGINQFRLSWPVRLRTVSRARPRPVKRAG